MFRAVLVANWNDSASRIRTSAANGQGRGKARREREEGREGGGGGVDTSDGYWRATGALGGTLGPPLPLQDRDQEREIEREGGGKKGGKGRAGRPWEGLWLAIVAVELRNHGLRSHGLEIWATSLSRPWSCGRRLCCSATTMANRRPSGSLSIAFSSFSCPPFSLSLSLSHDFAEELEASMALQRPPSPSSPPPPPPSLPSSLSSSFPLFLFSSPVHSFIFVSVHAGLVLYKPY